MELYNKQTGKKEVLLNSDDIHNAILSGGYSVPQGTKVPVYSPDGELGSVPDTNLFDAVKAGYKVQTPAQKAVQSYVDKRKGLADGIKVGLGQAADELLLGIPELIFDKTQSPLDVAKKEALKQEHDLANSVGGVSGFVGSMAFGGPIFKGAAKAGEAVTKGIATKLSTKIGEVAGERTVKSIARDIAAQAAGKTAGLGVEGALLATPHAITETALGDPEAGAEALLYGAGIGSLFGAGGQAIKGLSEISKRSTKALMGVAERSTLGETSAEAIKKLQRVFTGVPEDDIAHYIDMVKNERHTKVPTPEFIKDELDGAVRTKLDEITQAEQIYLGAKKDADEAYRANVRELQLTKPDVSLADELMVNLDGEKKRLGEMSTAAMDILDSYPDVRIPRDDMTKVFSDSIDALKIPGKSGKLVLVGEANKSAAAKIQARIDELAMLPDEIPLTDARRIIKSYDSDIDFGYAAGEFNDVQDKILKGFRKNTREMIGKSLEAADPIAAKAYKEQMEALSQRADALGRMSESFGTAPKALSSLERAVTGKDQIKQNLLKEFSDLTGQNWLAKLDDIKLKKAMLEESRIKAIPEKLTPELHKQVNEAKRVVDELSAKYDSLRRLGPNRTQSIIRNQGFRTASMEDRKALEYLSEITGKDFTQLIKDRNTYDTFFKERTQGTRRTFLGAAIGSAIGGTFGGALAGPMGAAIGAGVGASADIYAGRLVKAIIDASPDVSGLLFTEKALKKVAEKIDKIPEIMKRIEARKPQRMPGGRTSSMDAVRRMLTPYKDREEKPKQLNDSGAAINKRMEEFYKLKDRLDVLVSSPDGLLEKTASIGSIVGKTGAPNIGGAFGGKLQNATQYLYDQMPKPMKQKSVFAPKIKWRPSDYELSKFEAKVSVVEDPFVVLDELENGTLTRSHVEALEAVYPQIATFMKDKIIDEVFTKPADIPYTQRLKLSLLLGEDLDPTVSGKELTYYQTTFAEIDAMMQQGAKDGGSSDLASSLMSDQDALASRRERS